MIGKITFPRALFGRLARQRPHIEAAGVDMLDFKERGDVFLVRVKGSAEQVRRALTLMIEYGLWGLLWFLSG